MFARNKKLSVKYVGDKITIKFPVKIWEIVVYLTLIALAITIPIFNPHFFRNHFMSDWIFHFFYGSGVIILIYCTIRTFMRRIVIERKRLTYYRMFWTKTAYLDEIIRISIDTIDVPGFRGTGKTTYYYLIVSTETDRFKIEMRSREQSEKLEAKIRGLIEENGGGKLLKARYH